MEEWDPADRRPMIVFGKTTKGYWPGAVNGKLPGADQIVGYPSHPYGFKMNSEYFVSLAKTFEDRYGVQFAGIRDGAVTDPRERLIQFKTNMDVAMSVLERDGLGDWLADRLVEIGDTVKDDFPVRIDVKQDPFLDDRLRVSNLPEEPQSLTVKNPFTGADKQVKIALFKKYGETAGARRGISEIVKWLNYVTGNRALTLAADLSESVNLEHGSIWGHYDPEANPLGTRLNRRPSVALDERQHDVLALQPGEQLVVRGVPERVDGGLRLELRAVAQADRDLRGVLVDERGHAAGGDRHRVHELGAERRRAEPDHREHRDGLGRGPPSTGQDAREPQRRERHEHHHDDDEHAGEHRGADRGRPAERLVHEVVGVADERPVQHRVERALERREEAHVDDLDDGEQAQQAAADRGDDPTRPGREHEQHGDGDQALHRDAQERGRGELVDRLRDDERAPEHDSPASTVSTRRRTGRLRRVSSVGAVT